MIMELILEKLLKANYEAYIIGGAVRDYLLNKKPTDIDIVTNATPTVLRVIFDGHKIDTVGNNFLVTIIDGIEVATYRNERYQTASKPMVVPARTLYDDVKRRDLTINALALDPITHDIIDYFNGRSDLENGIIKFIGNPHERIAEDPVRIIRACRFLAVVNGTFEANTKNALIKYAIHIPQLPKERIRLEILKAMKIRRASLFFNALHDIGALKYIFPDLEKGINLDGGPYHNETVFMHNMLAGDTIATRCPITKLTGYLHDIGKGLTVSDEKGYNTFYKHDKIGADSAKKQLQELKFTNKEVDFVYKMINLHMYSIGGNKSIRKFLNSNRLYVESFLRIKLADDKANLKKNKALSFYKDFIRRIDEQTLIPELPFGVKDLKVNGNDVMEQLNIKPGPEVGKVLNDLLMQVLDDPNLNKKETLTDLIKEV